MEQFNISTNNLGLLLSVMSDLSKFGTWVITGMTILVGAAGIYALGNSAIKFFNGEQDAAKRFVLILVGLLVFVSGVFVFKDKFINNTGTDNNVENVFAK